VFYLSSQPFRFWKFLGLFLKFLFMKRALLLFIVKVCYFISNGVCVLNFWNGEDFFWPIRGIPLLKKTFLLWIRTLSPILNFAFMGSLDRNFCKLSVHLSFCLLQQVPFRLINASCCCISQQSRQERKYICWYYWLWNIYTFVPSFCDSNVQKHLISPRSRLSKVQHPTL